MRFEDFHALLSALEKITFTPFQDALMKHAGRSPEEALKLWPRFRDARFVWMIYAEGRDRAAIFTIITEGRTDA